MFFVISGFVVSHSVFTWRSNLLEFLSQFYSRRFLRILPALFVTLLVTSLLTALFIPTVPNTAYIARIGFWSSLGLSNWALIKESSNYFSDVAELNPFTHTWSLGIEEQFYLFFPFLIFPLNKFDRLRKLKPYFFIVLAIISFKLAENSRVLFPIESFYSLPTRFWQLCLGVAAHGFISDIRFQRRLSDYSNNALAKFGSALALVLITIGLFKTRADSFPDQWNTFTVLSTTYLLVQMSASTLVSSLASVLGSVPARYIGKRSYSLYLWHWPVIVLMRWTVGTETALMQTLAIALSFLLAELSFRFIEQRFTRHKARNRNARRLVLAGSLAAVALFTIINSKIFQYSFLLSLSQVNHYHTTWFADHIGLEPSRCAPKVDLKLGGDIYIIFFEPRPECHGGQNADRTLFIIGDSHAGTYPRFAYKFAQRTNTRVKVITQGGCAVPSLSKSGPPPYCDAYFAHVKDVLASAKAGDVLFLPSLRMPRATNGQWPEPPDGADVETVAASSLKQLGELVPAFVTVVFEAPKPIFRGAAFRCLDWFNSANPSCGANLKTTREFLEKYRKVPLRELNLLTAMRPRSDVWDPLPILCPDKTVCSAVRDRKPLFFDYDHMSGYSIDLIFESLASKLDLDFKLSAPAGS